MRKLITTVITIFLLSAVIVSSLCVSASSPVKSYTYDAAGEIKEIPTPYDVKNVFGDDGVSLKTPEDMAVYDGNIYILDSGNNRVVAVSSDFSNINIIAFSKNGTPFETKELRGIFVNKNGMYIADRGSAKVFLTDFSGNVIKEYTKPETDLLAEENLFMPLKVMVDSLNQVYILVENEYRGAITLSPDGEFIGFFGTGDVKVTAEVLIQNFWRNFKTDAQLDYTSKTLPVEYKNFAIDDNDFIYAVEASSTVSDQPLRKMNSQGTGILSISHIGDMELKSNDEKEISSSFNSVAVDEYGFITVLDSTWNRVFQYNQEGELLFVFGGSGIQQGTFTEPIDVACLGGEVLVLDKATGKLTVLVPTEFGNYVRQGSLLFYNGDFEESLEPWENVLRLDGNYQMAYVGIGKVYLMNRDYVNAMKYFEIADSKANYSIAFKRYRSIFLRENFNVIAVTVIALFAIIVALRTVLKKKKISLSINENIAYSWYCVCHPIDGFAEIRYNKKYCYPLSFALILVYALVLILGFFETGFIFNNNIGVNFNILIIAGVPVALIIVFVIMNWLMSSFFEGTGKLNQVFTVVTYALVPLIFSKILHIILSNVLTSEEGVFLNYLSVIGTILFLFILVFGLGSVHLANFKTNIALMGATVVGVVLLIFIVFLMFNLFAECASFIETLIKEISYRMSVGF